MVKRSHASPEDLPRPANLIRVQSAHIANHSMNPKNDFGNQTRMMYQLCICKLDTWTLRPFGNEAGLISDIDMVPTYIRT